MTRQRKLEIAATVLGLAGTALGTTDRWGILVCLISQVVWWDLLAVGRMWGLVPLNIGMTVVLLVNFGRVYLWPT